MPDRVNPAEIGGMSSDVPRSLLLSDEVLEFIQSGVSVTMAVVGTDGRAKPGRALAARVDRAGVIRILYPADENAVIAASAQSGGPIAVTFSAPLSHRTIQLKSMSSREEVVEPEDMLGVTRQTDAFAATLHMLGFAPAFVRAFCMHRSKSICVLSFSPETAFEQTPGPGAGREL